MEVEHISGISFTAWGATQQEGHLTVCDGLLGEIVVNDESVLAVVSEIFSHGTAGVRSQVLKGSGVGGGGGHDDGVFHGVWKRLEFSNDNVAGINLGTKQ